MPWLSDDQKNIVKSKTEEKYDLLKLNTVLVIKNNSELHDNKNNIDEESQFLDVEFGINEELSIDERNEVTEYFGTTAISHQNCPLKWWCDHESDFPILARMAKKSEKNTLLSLLLPLRVSAIFPLQKNYTERPGTVNSRNIINFNIFK